MDFRDYAFGVEIELTGAKRANVAQIIANFFNSEVIYEGGSYEVYSILDILGRKWQVMRDGSIRTEKKVNGTIVTTAPEYGIEIVSPILNYGDIEGLQAILRLLRKINCFPNSSTGIHIHIGLGYDIEAKKLCNLLKMFYAKQDLIYQALNVGEHRRKYCEKLSETLINKIVMEKPKDFSEFSDIWFEGFDRGGRYNRSRYRGINLVPILSGRMPTVEYRMFQFSNGIHAGELKSFIQFALTLTATCINAKSVSAKISIPITGNSRYAFRVYLLKLGFLGNEFKTARTHLLKNLTGNTAWRDRE